jgi:hypothetical protein
MIHPMRRRSATLTAALAFLLVAGACFGQEDERAQFKDFNWFEIMKQDSVSAFTALWDHAAKYKSASYDQKAILSALLDNYAAAKDLEKLFPYDASIDANAPYAVTYDRAYSDRLALPWAALLKLNVRTAMQYILLEILYVKGVPKSKGKVPTNVSLFGEYFGYYVTMKKAG